MSQQYSISILLKAVDQTLAPMNALKQRVDGLRSQFDKLKAPVAGLPQDIDRASSAMGRFGRSVETVARHVSKMRENLASLNVPQLQAQNAARRADYRSQAVDAVGLGMMFAKPMKDVFDFKQAVTDLGITAGLSASEMKEVEKRTKEWSRQSGQSLGDLMKGQNTLVAAGLKDDLVKQLMPSIANVAGAYRAEIDDVAKTAFTAFDTLKVPAGEMAKAFDSLSNASKEGNFELKDMARYFPELAAMAKGVKLEGMEAINSLGAMLQISRKGAGTNEAAATNLANFLSKILAPDAIKNFAERGVDIDAVLKDALKKGINPVEAALQKIAVLTKGGDEKLIGELFGDMQVKNFLRAMLQNLPEYQRIKQSNAAARGTVDADKAKRDASFDGQVTRALAALNRLSIALGDALIPAVSVATMIFNKLASWAEAMNETMPGTLSAVMSLLAGLVALKIGAIAIGWLFTFVKGGALSVFGLLQKTGMFGKPAGAAGIAAGLLKGGVQPVFVVNMPGSGFSGLPGIGDLGKAAKGGVGEAVKDAAKGGLGGRVKALIGGVAGAGLLGMAGKLAKPIGMAMDVYDFGSAAVAGDARGMGSSAGSLVGGLGGAWGGAAAGAAIGSIVPFVGTAIGGVIGAALGGWFGSSGGSALGAEIADNLANKSALSGAGATTKAQEMAAWFRGEKPALSAEQVAQQRLKGDINLNISGLPAGVTATATSKSGDLNVLAKSGPNLATVF